MNQHASILQITYVSKASIEFGTSDLVKLLIDARNFNQSNEITGILIFENNRFLQVIEGMAETIESLYQKIVDDGRHHDVNMIASTQLDARRFPKWTMAFAEPGSLAVSHFRGFLPIPGTLEQANTTEVLTEANKLIAQFSGFFHAQ
jgi:hypothetical protein